MIHAPTLHDDRWWSIDAPFCQITIERRPPYCDRGRYLAKVFPRGRFALEFDEADGWPRYYFDWDRMLAEIEAWLQMREEQP
ncbi:MAG TPA: hypothetical protein VK631_10995 [Solirubrobacteraceae bacterium]|nr:hypothetical protein [Solirubrobacteraceae bacterium]